VNRSAVWIESVRDSPGP